MRKRTNPNAAHGQHSTSKREDEDGSGVAFLRYWLPGRVWMALIFSGSADKNWYAHSSMFFEPLVR
jgi:hypothetical protein